MLISSRSITRVVKSALQKSPKQGAAKAYEYSLTPDPVAISTASAGRRAQRPLVCLVAMPVDNMGRNPP